MSMANLYPIGSLTMDPSRDGLALLEAGSSTSHGHCLSQISFESGLAERMPNFDNNGWPRVSGRSTKPQINGDADLRRVCHEVEAFEARAAARDGTPLLPGNEWNEAGHVQQDNSSSSEQTAALQNMVGQASGKRKSKDSTMSNCAIKRDGKGSEGDQKKVKCAKTGVADVGKGADEAKTTLKEEHRSTSEQSGDLSPRSLKASSKLQAVALPKQDYIHVRARRGQATDSHSLAERVRREKISERMKFLQDLVPGCSKVTGKAVMLDEIINYVQSLQRQIEFLSMKLANVDPRLDSHLENLFNKELVQARSPETTLMGPDPLAGLRDYQTQLQIQQQINNCHMDLRSVGTLCDEYLRRSMNITPVHHAPLPYTGSFMDSLTQSLNGICDGDLQAILHMGNNHGREELFGSGLIHGIAPPGLLSTGYLKAEY